MHSTALVSVMSADMLTLEWWSYSDWRCRILFLFFQNGIQAQKWWTANLGQAQDAPHTEVERKARFPKGRVFSIPADPYYGRGQTLRVSVIQCFLPVSQNCRTALSILPHTKQRSIGCPADKGATSSWSTSVLSHGISLNFLPTPTRSFIVSPKPGVD